MTDGYLLTESPNTYSADEEACLRSLSFTEIYSRESTIEPAIQDSGSWLLESQNFRDWIHRKSLDKHGGFLWIQGNPGSGKSTLMKRVYSLVTASSQDPSSVIAAFFFNARGNEIERTPIGLLRTLLHNLCQRISTLRDLVVKAYVAKRRLLDSDWHWQFSELKDFLAAVVKSSVLGQRSLTLFIDALDECDLTATQSAIYMFESLASSSLSEGTKFSICLSSRYWPQFRIQTCFIARVELENKGDIDRYIQKHLEPTQVDEDPGVHFALRNEILNKAQGTFIWVVLVVRDLLSAYHAGATLRELRNIVERVPLNLHQFYQHQLQSTKGEDRQNMLRLLQLVFYAQRSLSLTEVRYALAFGCRSHASYAEWSQSSEYVRNDEQMEKRIREHSKGLVEIAQSAEYDQDPASSKRTIVQFIHQSVRDFLTADGFSFLRDSRQQTNTGDGHEFIKIVCLNYLRIKDVEAISLVDIRVDFVSHRRNLLADHPLLNYVVNYIFLHAGRSEEHGVSQESFRNYICTNRDFFERWRILHDAIVGEGFEEGPQARPIHIFSEYGLLTREIAEKERNIDIAGGAFGSALGAACFSGHPDAVRILLELEANPRLEARYYRPVHNTGYYPDVWAMASLAFAISMQRLPVLHLLLNSKRSSFTLQERFKLSSHIGKDFTCVGLRAKSRLDQSDEILALLFPETSFPDSARHELYEVARTSTPAVFSFLLDKFDESIVHEEIMWQQVLAGGGPQSLSKIRVLLDRGGRVKITSALVKTFNKIEIHRKPSGVSEAISLLLEDCEVEMTEKLVDSISAFEDSPQIIRTFEAAGYRFDPFTPRQILQALRSGSAKSAAFFLQPQYEKVSKDEMLESALSNESHGEEVTRLLLGYQNPDCINEQAIMTALGNINFGGDLIRLLYSRWSNPNLSGAALAIAVGCQPPEAVKFVLKLCKSVIITETILTAAARNISSGNIAEIFELLLLHDPDVCIQESTVVAIIEGIAPNVETFDTIRTCGKYVSCTENVVAAAARHDQGSDALDIVLQQDRNAKITSPMIMVAMKAKHGAALASIMLHYDHTLIIEEEHLLAGAANRFDPRGIFALLQSKGKLKQAGEVRDTNRAKRCRRSRKLSPRITTKVIDAAFSNPNEAARGLLLELFVEWGIITQAELDSRMYIAPFDIPSSSRSTPEI